MSDMEWLMNSAQSGYFGGAFGSFSVHSVQKSRYSKQSVRGLFCGYNGSSTCVYKEGEELPSCDIQASHLCESIRQWIFKKKYTITVYYRHCAWSGIQVQAPAWEGKKPWWQPGEPSRSKTFADTDPVRAHLAALRFVVNNIADAERFVASQAESAEVAA
jgi:hypothetical protein